MAKEVTAIFDIGKTNKKFLLFDSNLEVVYSESIAIEEIEDEDGYPCEDLGGLVGWLKVVFDRILTVAEYKIKTLNFSSYGASFVHLDEVGEVLSPLYNYTKPIDSSIKELFYSKYGPEDEFLRSTGTLKFDMLSSGCQLFWLRHEKPELFKKIKYSLHLPQYISYIFTKIPVSEYTSIGCHTGLWNYPAEEYHHWVSKEGIDLKLPDIVPSDTLYEVVYNSKKIKIGVGIHDSSAALLPYLRASTSPFILVSTGTWCVAFNPFSDSSLTLADLGKGCLNYMQISGKAVKSSSLQLGREHDYQVERLAEYHRAPRDFCRDIKFDVTIFHKIVANFTPMFEWKYIEGAVGVRNSKKADELFDYHQLMYELVEMQVKSIDSIKGSIEITNLYIEGGFVDNELYLKMLSARLPTFKIQSSHDPLLGSALGAVLVTSKKQMSTMKWTKFPMNE